MTTKKVKMNQKVEDSNFWNAADEKEARALRRDYAVSFRLRTSPMGAHRVDLLAAGQIYDLDAGQADRLVALGFASHVE